MIFLFFVKWENLFKRGIKKILEKKERQIINMIRGNEYLSSYSAKKKIDKKVTIEKFKKTIFFFIKHISLKILKIFLIQVPSQNYHIFY